MATKKINIAIDGFSSTGKSTMAKQLAKKLGYKYIDTGAMYRAIAYWALKNGFIKEQKVDLALLDQLDKIQLDFKLNPTSQNIEIELNHSFPGEQIRSKEVANIVSEVATISEVRRKLVKSQQEIANQKGVVMDGRDIGTVVLPDAELKIFMTASHEIRTKRRYEEMLAKGTEISLDEVSENLKKRDYQDSNRADSPLKQADDAKLLDNSHISQEEQLELALNWVKEKL